MAKKGASSLSSGTAVRVNDGVSLPEFPEISISGWTGEVIETKGRGAAMQYIIQWDEQTISAIPQDYRDHCEEHGLTHEMVCLPKGDVEAVE
jgi:hypothetical protein